MNKDITYENFPESMILTHIEMFVLFRNITYCITHCFLISGLVLAYSGYPMLALVMVVGFVFLLLPFWGQAKPFPFNLIKISKVSEYKPLPGWIQGSQVKALTEGHVNQYLNKYKPQGLVLKMLNDIKEFQGYLTVSDILNLVLLSKQLKTG